MKVEINNLNEVFITLQELEKEKAELATKEITQQLWENVRFFAKPHYVTGMLERNIRHKFKNTHGVVWIDNENMVVEWRGKRVNYAEFVLKGTKPHKIRPKKRKSLRYNSLDEFIFSKGVNHPGYEGDDFIKKAIDKTMSQLENIVKGI